jgi:hypothetical protein
MDLRPEHIQQVRETLDKAIANYVAGLPKRVEALLNQAILGLFGFRLDSFDRGVQVDPHREKGNSALLTILLNRCKDATEQHIDAIATQTINGLIDDPKFRKTVATEAAGIFKRTLGKALDEAVQKRAVQAAEHIVENLDKYVTAVTDVLPTNIDVEDPKSFETDVGKLIEEEIARLMAAGKPAKAVSVQRSGGRTLIITDEFDQFGNPV